MSSPSPPPTPKTSHKVDLVLVQLQFRTPPPAKDANTKTGRKSAAPKGKIENKNKELPFTFDLTEDNYLSFLSALLKKHGHEKYTPVTKQRRFGIKVSIGSKKLKKDALDVDDQAEYILLVGKILEEEPAKITVYLNLEDVKLAAKRRGGTSDSSGDEENHSDKDSGDEAKTGIERELGRLRGLLEKKYANPADSGYTYVTNDGERVPLTPSMMSEWARTIYDSNTTTHHPPNTLSFDPKTRSRSLFQAPKTPLHGNSNNDGAVLPTISLMTEYARILVGSKVDPPTTPLNANQMPTNFSSGTSVSPPKHSPSKLPAFLCYAEEHLGVKNATMYEYSLDNKGYGPDILPYVEDKEVAECGITAGDVIRLKRGAAQWWNSPEAKRPRLQNTTSATSTSASHAAADTDDSNLRRSIRFEKRFTEGGCTSVFGPGMVPGQNYWEKEFVWWFYNTNTKSLEKVPNGLVPDIDPEYLDMNAPPYEPSPSPTEAAQNE